MSKKSCHDAWGFNRANQDPLIQPIYALSIRVGWPSSAFCRIDLRAVRSSFRGYVNGFALEEVRDASDRLVGLFARNEASFKKLKILKKRGGESLNKASNSGY